MIAFRRIIASVTRFIDDDVNAPRRAASSHSITYRTSNSRRSARYAANRSPTSAPSPRAESRLTASEMSV